jgi:hypothetical protein
MIFAISRTKKDGVDLNIKLVQSSGFCSGDGDAYWQDSVCPTHGFFALDPVHTYRRPLRWQPPGTNFFLCRTVSGDGLCAADLPGKLARHRSLPLGPSAQAVPPGLSGAGSALDAGRCQRIPRLAHLCGICSAPDCASQKTVCPGRPGTGIVEHGLRARFDDHRLVSVRVSLGPVPLHQIGGETAHLARPPGQHSKFHSHLRGQAARRACARFADPRSGRDLRHGSGLRRFRQASCLASGRWLLCHPRQVEPEGASGLLPAGRPQHGADVRPDHCAGRFLHPERLSRAFAPYPLQRPRQQQDLGVSEQPIRFTPADDLCALQASLASGNLPDATYKNDRASPQALPSAAT